ncbi:response regulator [bacterium]|nr:MAG: response regulator [bacterium]
MTDIMSERLVEILLVEDNPGDIRLTQEAFKQSKVSNRLHIATDGLEALAFLKREGLYEDAPIPDLILLDLNLPKKEGREVLEEIKQDKTLRHIPVVVLTISDADDDIRETYNLHANCFITKPVDFNQFVKVVQFIEKFWLTVVDLPGEE